MAYKDALVYLFSLTAGYVFKLLDRQPFLVEQLSGVLPCSFIVYCKESVLELTYLYINKIWISS